MIPEDHEPPETLSSLRADLDSPEPIGFLSAASSMISILDPAPTSFDSYRDDEDDLPPITLSEFLETLLVTPTEETDSLLVACAQILGDPDLQSIVNTQVKPRLPVMPAWLAELARLRVKKAAVFDSVLGGEEAVALEATGPRGGFALMVVVVRQGSPFIQDAYAVPETIDQLSLLLTDQEVEEVTVQPLSLEDARARVEDALRVADMMVPPVETDSWPAIRPLLEWQLRQMPEGGCGYVYEEWSREQIDSLANDFAASPHASDLTPSDLNLTSLLISLALNYGTGNPLQWNGFLVEQLLLDLVPRKVLYPDEDLMAIPRVLSRFTAYCNQVLGVPASTASQVQQLIEDLTPHYLDAVDPDLMAPAAQGAPTSPITYLADAVGGEEALETLTVEPLPAGEETDLGDVDEDVRDLVKTIASLVGTYAPQFFEDPEMVTAAQRTLRLIATEKPEAFRRRSKDLNTAAARRQAILQDRIWLEENVDDMGLWD